MRKAFQYRLYPSKAQERKLEATRITCQKWYNELLAERKTAYEERGFAAFRAYYEYLPRGKHVVEYTVRLNNPGRFALPPSRVEAMYAPESFAESPNPGIEVAP